MPYQANSIEDSIHHQVAEAMGFWLTFPKSNLIHYKRDGRESGGRIVTRTVTVFRTNSTVMLQPYNVELQSVKRASLKNLTVFLEAVVRLDEGIPRYARELDYECNRTSPKKRKRGQK